MMTFRFDSINNYESGFHGFIILYGGKERSNNGERIGWVYWYKATENTSAGGTTAEHIRVIVHFLMQQKLPELQYMNEKQIGGAIRNSITDEVVRGGLLATVMKPRCDFEGFLAGMDVSAEVAPRLVKTFPKYRGSNERLTPRALTRFVAEQEEATSRFCKMTDTPKKLFEVIVTLVRVMVGSPVVLRGFERGGDRGNYYYRGKGGGTVNDEKDEEMVSGTPSDNVSGKSDPPANTHTHSLRSSSWRATTTLRS